MKRTGSDPRYSPSTWQADGMLQRTKRDEHSRSRTCREAMCFPRKASRTNFTIDQRPIRALVGDDDVHPWQRAQVVGSDPDADLAVLKVDLKKLPAMMLGRSEGLRVGDVVLAIGNPFGVGQTVTMGIVSATGRNRLGINTFENFIQTDAAINPGNSGGALVDAAGNLVGINTAIFSQSGGNQGIGFAIPTGLAQSVLQDILQYGRPQRGWLGIEAQAITPEIAQQLNVRAAERVSSNSLTTRKLTVVRVGRRFSRSCEHGTKTISLSDPLSLARKPKWSSAGHWAYVSPSSGRTDENSPPIRRRKPTAP